LDILIMESLGLWDGKDETFKIYDEIMDRRSKKIEADNDTIMKQALKVYHELLNEKRRLSYSKKRDHE
jgi:preprotein translocase subunit SecA